MRKIGIILLFICQGLLAQNTKGVTGIPDTSFANYSAWKSALQSDPSLRLAEYTFGTVPKAKSIVYKQIGARKLVLDIYGPQDSKPRKSLLFFHQLNSVNLRHAHLITFFLRGIPPDYAE